jgi:hypothetical protein
VAARAGLRHPAHEQWHGRQKFRQPETSGLKYTIAPDTKELNIEIPG